jgi:hypothetical protein
MAARTVWGHVSHDGLNLLAKGSLFVAALSEGDVFKLEIF